MLQCKYIDIKLIYFATLSRRHSNMKSSKKTGICKSLLPLHHPKHFTFYTISVGLPATPTPFSKKCLSLQNFLLPQHLPSPVKHLHKSPTLCTSHTSYKRNKKQIYQQIFFLYNNFSPI